MIDVINATASRLSLELKDLQREDPTLALIAIKGIVARSEAWTVLAVRAAREQGKSWYEIGKALGMSRQAAQQRFGPHVAA